ncbi:glycosyltransferase family 39 protein [bacterium]|nr:glycosyltransferase family 39 protein [bacterium]
MIDQMFTSNKFWISVLLILFLAAALRLCGVDRMSLWGDEACMVYLCQESSSSIVEALASADRPDVDVAPPLYFLILHGWMNLFGTSLLAFRGFSVLFGVLTVLCVIGLGNRLFGHQLGLIAGVLAAISPFQIWYSQEGRMYTMASCLAAAAMWSLISAIKRPRKFMGWSGFGISGLALIYTQYYGALLLAGLVGFVLLQICIEHDNRKYLIRGLAATVIFWTIVFAPWLPVLIVDYRHAGASGGFPLMFHWLQTPIFLYLKNILFGNQTYVLDHLWLYPLPLLTAATALIVALLRIRQAEVQMLTLAAVFPFSLVYALSLFGLRVYKSHPFIIFHPAVLVLLAYGIMQLKPIHARVSMVILGASQIFILSTLVLSGDYVKPRSEDVANWIENHAGSDTCVAVIPAFIPNPMPIVGDLLAFKYHSGNQFNTLYLTGNTAQQVVESIFQHAVSENCSRDQHISVVCQLNPQVQPFLDDIFKELDRRWSRRDSEEFRSRSRGFSMMVIQYDITKI